MSTISFRPYLPKDAEAVSDLFMASIEELAVDDYDKDQRAAWASAAEDVAGFGANLAGMLSILAEAEGELLGFAALKDNKIIEMLYVAPDHAGKGVGKALVGVMELLARQRGAEMLTVDASEVACEFFAHLGYEKQARNTVMRAGEWLANTTMTKKLPPAPKADA